jgi:hypothetical protein
MSHTLRIPLTLGHTSCPPTMPHEGSLKVHSCLAFPTRTMCEDTHNVRGESLLVANNRKLLSLTHPDTGPAHRSPLPPSPFIFPLLALR